MTTISAVFQILRRLTGAAGAPALKAGQLFSNEVENVLYVGTGNDGSGNSTAQVAVGGAGAFVPKAAIISVVDSFGTSVGHALL